MATRQTSAAIERVWSQLPESAREVLESELSPTDLQSLLLSLAQTRARRTRPADALRRWKSDRFVRPAPIDPGWLSEVENRLWQQLRTTRSLV
jgi:thioesterase domain-containing protein